MTIDTFTYPSLEALTTLPAEEVEASDSLPTPYLDSLLKSYEPVDLEAKKVRLEETVSANLQADHDANKFQKDDNFIGYDKPSDQSEDMSPEDQWKQLRKKVSLRLKIKERRIIETYRLRGVSDLQQVLTFFRNQLLEGYEFKYELARLLAPKTPSFYLKENKTIELLEQYFDTLNHPEVISFIAQYHKQLVDVSKIIKYYHGGDFSLADIRDDTPRKELFTVLVDLPLDQQHEKLMLLRQYPFLRQGIKGSDLDKNVQFLIEFLSFRPLTNKEKTVLERLALLLKVTDSSSRNYSVTDEGSLADILNSADRIENDLVIYLFTAFGGRKNYVDKFRFLESCAFLFEDGLQEAVAKLSHAGWDVNNVLERIHAEKRKSPRDYDLPAQEQVELAASVQSRLKNPTYARLLTFINESRVAGKLKGYWPTFFDMANLNDLDGLFSQETISALDQEVKIFQQLGVEDAQSELAQTLFFYDGKVRIGTIDFYRILETHNSGDFSELARFLLDKKELITSELLTFLLSRGEAVTSYFHEGRLTYQAVLEFYQSGLSANFIFASTVLLNPSFCPPELIPLAEYLGRFKQSGLLTYIGQKPEHWSAYIKNGQVSSLLFEHLLLARNSYLVSTLLSEETVAAFSAVEQEFWNYWLTLPLVLRDKVSYVLEQGGGINEKTVEKLSTSFKLIERLADSSSLELQTFREQILSALMEVDDAESKLELIIKVFERNDIPSVGKIYLVFELLYKQINFQGADAFEVMLNKQSHPSPILEAAGERRRYSLIYNDLLKLHLDSDNTSLHSYLVEMVQGDDLLARYATDQTTITPRELANLERFIDKAERLVDVSQLPGSSSDSANSLSDRIARLQQTLGSNRVTDRLTQMYARPLGFSELTEMIDFMSKNKRRVSEKNKESAESGRVEIAAGDLLKGMSIEFFDLVLDNGATAPEFLGVNSGNDATPFDTDLSMVLDEDMTDGWTSAIDQSKAKSYGESGGMYLLFKQDTPFYRSDQEQQLNFRHEGYELFMTGLFGPQHYGIRTGIPLSEAAAIVVTPATQADRVKLHRIYLHLALKDMYIPVVDQTGKIIFTYEDFERFRLDSSRVAQESKKVADVSSEQSEQAINDLVDTFKRNEYFKRVLEGPAYVEEGYSLEHHIKTVMKDYKLFLANEKLGILTPEEFVFMLVVHDLGKPMAQELRGSTLSQHEFTLRIIAPIMSDMGMPTQTVERVRAIIEYDLLGDLIKGITNIESTVTKITLLAGQLKVAPADLLQTMKVFYLADAGAYTQRTGGAKGLDDLFVFSDHSMQLIPELQTKLDQVQQQLSSKDS